VTPTWEGSRWNALGGFYIVEFKTNRRDVGKVIRRTVDDRQAVVLAYADGSTRVLRAEVTTKVARDPKIACEDEQV